MLLRSVGSAINQAGGFGRNFGPINYAPSTPPITTGNTLIWATGNNLVWASGNNLIWGTA